MIMVHRLSQHCFDSFVVKRSYLLNVKYVDKVEKDFSMGKKCGSVPSSASKK